MRQEFFSFICLTFLVLFSISSAELTENPIVITVPSYNNMQWLEKNLNSILAQDYTNVRTIYVDDCSSDGTGERVKQFLEEHNVPHRQIFFEESPSCDIQQSTNIFISLVNEDACSFILVRNTHRWGALANLYRSIHSCRNDEIVATMDGDDWFPDGDVLKKINAAYHSGEVWLTHGTLREYPHGHVAWCEPVPDEIIAANTFRTFKCPSHLRTFYSWLFKKIKLEDLLYQGQFYPMTWDMAMMYPMIEMAGDRHRFVADVTYVYNMANQINDNKVNAQLQNDLDKIIRNQPPYEKLNLD